MQKINQQDAQKVLTILERFNSVLGVINFEAKDEEIPHDLVKALDDRLAARANKDWAKADELRDYIQNRGYIIEDSAAGSRLKIKTNQNK